ncbi:APC family permease [Finegoldia magna]|uniref:Putative amino acid transporter n=1 Tax=Finegoldia magna (strain ATCC 29328 / DSM 20472 / WAL 2508) TaxID=334413 RepID=B0S034_FINM2|nr:APC family permease [Finegoldia magna]MSB16215.1 amino acid permease [Finegoldia magna]MSD44953.1 amino acid permease [Finegoldia magna]UEA71007.1 APC family permease [Finegoldia magna]BAG07629.1 putative amino acid transporter [Finegoldia magna ATCC 29328]
MNNATKKLGFWSIVLLTINSIIGSGIFLSPGSVVKMSGKYAPFIYLAAAAFAAVLAITFASSAKYVSKGGASYAYTKAAFGDNWGLYIGITRFFSAAIAWGVMATGVVKTMLNIFGADSTNFNYITAGFIILMTILFIINVCGTRILELVSNISTIGKLLALVTAIVAGLILVITTGQNNFSQIETVTADVANNMDLGTIVMAVIAAFYAFTGFESVASGSEDMEQPEKNLPKAIPLGIVIIAVIYFGIVLVSMMIDPVAMVNTKEVVALVAIFKNHIVRSIILYGSLISMFGINVAASFHTPRIIESMANENQVPKIFAKRTDKGFPLFSMVITAVLAIILPIAFKYHMGSIMIISAIARFAQFIVVPLALIWFYYGKNKQEVVSGVKKNFFTDVIIPVVALLLTIVLLAKFSWVKQFTVDNNGVLAPNYLAIVSMFIGYVLVPLFVYFYNNKHK